MENAGASASIEPMRGDHFRKMFEGHGAIMLLVCPKEGQILDANPAAQQFYGLTRDELKAKHIFDLNALSPELVRHEMAAAAEERRNYFVFPHHAAGGEIKTVEVFRIR